MKRLFYLMLVVLGTMAFVSCSDDDENNNGGNDGNNSDGGNGTITLVTEAEDISHYYFGIGTFNEGDIVTIDWGDGITKSYKTEERDEVGDWSIYLDYTYTDDKSNHTITIRCDRGIKSITCYETKVTSLNVNDCTELVGLWCGDNMLTSLDVSKNTALERLDCYGNSLASLDISKNTALTFLECSNNQLTTLDVGKNTALTTLWCYGNSLTSLDVSKNTALAELECYSNQLTLLDVSGCKALTYLRCHYNQFTAAEMNKIYEALPTVEDGYLSCDELGDPSIAEQKGWNVS